MHRKFLTLALILALAFILALHVGAEETPVEATDSVGEVFTEAETKEAENGLVEGSADESTWLEDMGVDIDGFCAWFQAEVLPHLTSVAMIICVASVEIIPAVRSLIKAKAAFSKVASDVDTYNQSKIKYDLRVEKREKAFEERIEKMQAEHNKMVAALNETVNTYKDSLAESEERLAKVLHIVETRASKVERMVYLGMSNSCELVANGAARKIAEIEEEPDIPEEEACYYE